MNKFKTVTLVVLAIVAIVAVSFGSTYLGQEWDRFFGTRQADVERSIFEGSNAYNRAKLQDLNDSMREYNTAKSQSDKSIIAAYVRTEFADYNDKNLNASQRAFIEKCLNGIIINESEIYTYE